MAVRTTHNEEDWPGNRQGGKGGHPKTFWSKRLLVLIVIEWWAQCSFYMSTPIMNGYALSYGASIALAGALCGLNSFAALLFRPLSGLVGSKFPHRSLLIFSLAGYSACTIAMAAFGTLATIAICRTIQGVFFALQSTLLLCMIANTVPQNCMGQATGWVGIAVSAASAVGPALSLTIASHFDYAFSLYASGISAALCLILVPFIVPDAPKEKAHANNTETVSRNSRDAFMNRLICAPAIPYSIMSASFSLCTSCITCHIALLASQRGIEPVSLYFIVYSMTLVFTRPYGGKLSDKIPLFAIVIPSCLLCIAAIAIIAFSRELFAIVIAAVLMACGYGLGSPSLQAQCLRAGRENLDAASSTSFIGCDIGNALGPGISGLFITAGGYCAGFLLESGFLVITLISCIALMRRAKHCPKAL